MKFSKVLALVLAVVLISSAFSATASAKVVDFKPVVESGRLCGIGLNTPQTVLRDIFSSYDVKIYNKNQQEVAADADVNIGTGFKIRLNNNLFYNLVVMGDIDGDGNLGSMDYLAVKRAVLGQYNLTATAMRAAEVMEGDDIRAMNYIKVKRAYFGTYDINKAYKCDPYESSNPPVGDGWSDGWV